MYESHCHQINRKLIWFWTETECVGWTPSWPRLNSEDWFVISATIVHKQTMAFVSHYSVTTIDLIKAQQSHWFVICEERGELGLYSLVCGRKTETLKVLMIVIYFARIHVIFNCCHATKRSIITDLHPIEPYNYNDRSVKVCCLMWRLQSVENICSAAK